MIDDIDKLEGSKGAKDTLRGVGQDENALPEMNILLVDEEMKNRSMDKQGSWGT